jgi:iron complex transport system ATP-binding protein
VLLLAGGAVVAAGPLGTTLTAEALSRCVGIDVTVDHTDGRWAARARPQASRAGPTPG